MGKGDVDAISAHGAEDLATLRILKSTVGDERRVDNTKEPLCSVILITRSEQF